MTGRVVLVGGGPGAADLVTLRGYRALLAADVVVVDRLAPLDLLDELPPHVEVVHVGKAPGRHTVPQEAINALLVQTARAGRVVVRLKGGDPYVLGRGAEEVAACRAAGVDVDVVPGVSSALAAPAAAGVPVTCRGLSRGVAVVDGHDALDWEALRSWRGTLVVLMGVATLRRTTRGLLDVGWDPALPAVVVERGCTPAQRTTTGTLADIADRAERAGVRPPAVIVLGAVAGLAAAPATGAAGATMGT